ncbi:MAG: phage tail protein, partial [Wenzhouxiangellaceae bacterium]
GDLGAPSANRSLARSGGGFAYQQSAGNLVPLNQAASQSAGGSQPHNNMQPFVAMSFIIALQGLYPSRS